MKTCFSCKVEKPIEEFCLNKRKKDGRETYCRSCTSTKQKKYSKKISGRPVKRTTESQKDYNFRWRHNLERSVAIAQVEEQGHCKICKTELLKEFRDWVLDHDHNCCPKNKSCDNCRRGFICQACNKVLGFAKDNIETLQAAISYLEEYNRSKIDGNIQ